MSAALDALLDAEHRDPGLIGALDADDDARLRALAYDAAAPQRRRAVELGARSDPAGWAPQLLTLLADATAATDVRLAAADGLGRSGLGALVLQPALQSQEPAVAVAAWRIVAALAAADELGVLATLPRPADPVVAAQASFGLATIAHRHGIAGYDAPAPGPRDLLALDPGRPLTGIGFAPATAADAAPLDAIERPALHGLVRDLAATWLLRVGDAPHLLVFDAAVLHGGPAAVLAAPRLLGVLACVPPGRGDAVVGRLLLTTPVGATQFALTVHALDGTPVAHGLCGVTTAGRPALTVTLRAVARPGAAALDVAFLLDGSTLEETRALVQRA